MEEAVTTQRYFRSVSELNSRGVSDFWYKPGSRPAGGARDLQLWAGTRHCSASLIWEGCREPRRILS
jgi:hypothetical protein